MSVPRDTNLPVHSYGSGAHYGELPLESFPAGDATGDIFYYSGTNWTIVPLNTVAGSGSSGSSPTVVDHGAMGATETFDASAGSDHEGTQDANLTVTLTGATTGQASYLTLVLTQDATGGRTLTLPASVVTKSDVESAWDTTANAVNILTLFTYDGGTTWYGFLAGGSGSGASALDDLTDVSLSSPAAADRFRYDGAAWVNSDLHWEPMVTYDGIVMLDSAGNPHMHEVSH